MQVELNQYDGLSLARDQRMNQKPVATFFLIQGRK